MNKITFPKGSLKIKKVYPNTTINNTPKIDEKSVAWRNELKFYPYRRKFIKELSKLCYPLTNLITNGEDLELDLKNWPPDLRDNFNVTKDQLKITRSKFKYIESKFSYVELTFNHPKWSKLIGEIKLTAKRNNLKDAYKEILKEFKQKKDLFRKFRIRQKSHSISSLQSTITYNVSGGVIYMPNLKQGVYIQFLKDQEKKIVFSGKSPKESTNHVGIEIEFFCKANKDQLGLMLYEAGLGRNVTLKGDSSIRPDKSDQIPHELCVIAKETEYKEVMKKVTDILSKVGAQVNKSCGLHVHLDMRNRDVEKAYQNLVSSQNILYRMNPKSRLEQYAKKIQERNFEVAKNGDRYFGINPTAHKKHSTIEVRIHAGTVDYTKITNWITILLNVANHNERLTKYFVSIKSFCETFNIDEQLKEYIMDRVNKFKIKTDVLGNEIEVPQAERGVA